MADAPKLEKCIKCGELRPPVFYKGQGPYCAHHYNEAKKNDPERDE
jgi:hypothetical protein